MRAELLADALLHACDDTDLRENKDVADIAPSAMIVSAARALRLTIMGYYVLLAFWAVSAGRQTRGGKNLDGFEAFVRSELLRPGRGEPESLFVGIPFVPSEPALGVAMRHLWHDAAELSNPMIDGSAPFDASTFRLAIIGLLARKALIRLYPTDLWIDEQSMPTNRILLTMAALAERISGRVAPNEIVMLVHD